MYAIKRKDKKQPTKAIKSQIKARGGKSKYFWDWQDLGDLAKILASIDNEKEIKRFLKDLFTDREMADILRRLHAAKLLYFGYNFEQIHKFMGMSHNTIASINESLEHGQDSLKKSFKKLLR